MQYDISHLVNYQELASGPVQSDEALFLFSLVKVLRPKVLVEIGFFQGHSAKNFLTALPENSQFYSFDCGPESLKIASQIADPRFKFIFKKQQDFQFSDIDNNLIDFLFIDAAHDLNLNFLLFEKIRKYLSKEAIIAIHDTGSWNKELAHEVPIFKNHIAQMRLEDSKSDINDFEFAHQPDERRFVNFIKLLHPEFQQIHLHSLNTIRHGLTILQPYKELPLKRAGTMSVLKQALKKFFPFLAIGIFKMRLMSESQKMKQAAQKE